MYPDRELNPYEINHIISTHFNDVRLKNFIELRHWDSLPIERAERLTEIVSSLFYVPEHRERLESYFEGISEEEVFEAKANIQAHGREVRHTASRSISGRNSWDWRASCPTFPAI